VARSGFGANGEFEHHVVSVRMRVTGAGNLQCQYTDLGTGVDVLDPIVMQTTTAIEPTKLANFQAQRIRFELKTTVIDEHFLIRRIVLYAKQVAAEYPM